MRAVATSAGRASGAAAAGRLVGRGVRDGGPAAVRRAPESGGGPGCGAAAMAAAVRAALLAAALGCAAAALIPAADVKVEVLQKPFLCHRRTKWGDMMLVHYEGYLERDGSMFHST